ncbi:MAG: stage V sporulation protein AD [Clostridia bacterium]
MKRIGEKTIEFKNQPRIIATSSLVGQKEADGAYGQYFHKVMNDDKMQEQTYEKAERIMLQEAFEDANDALVKMDKKISMLIGGDLLNQNITMSFTAREMKLPLIGVYSACSTMSESLAIGSILVDGGYNDNVACGTVSHFSSAERQYRFPLEQGTQRPPVSQWTVTGAGVCVLGSSGNYPKITKATFGEVVDFGIKDANNMGAAMAPAAMNTLTNFFADTNTQPKDYDLILSGDLGLVGSDILTELMQDRNLDISGRYQDCGAMIYEGLPHIYQGGSGAGCSASIFSSYIYQSLCKHKINKMLYVATGALLSTTSTQQGESIPCIAHLVEVIS